MFKELSAPVTVQWELTPWCDRECMWCYNYWRAEFVTTPKISEEAIRIHEAAVADLIANRVFHVTVTGGEPLGVITKYYPLLQMLRDKGITISVNTNLSLLDERKTQDLKDLGIKSFLTSLPSTDPELTDLLVQRKGAHERTLAGINLAISSGFRVAVNMTVTKKNIHMVWETGKLAKKLGAVSFCATKASAPANCSDFSEFALSIQELDFMFQELLRVRDELNIPVDSLEHYPACVFPDEDTMTTFGARNCSAGKTCCTIGFDGQIRPCSHAHLRYGTTLNDAWKAMGQWRNGELIPVVCKETCGKHPKSCGGGCRIEAYNDTGNIAGSDPFCKRVKPEIEKRSKRQSDFPRDTLFRLRPGIRFRQEIFGYIVYLSGSRWAPIEEKLFKVLQQDNFSAEQITAIYDVPEDKAHQTLQYLRAKQLIRPIKL